MQPWRHLEINGLRHPQLYYSLVENPLTHYNALIERAHRYAEGEEAKTRQIKFENDQKQIPELSRHTAPLQRKMEDAKTPTREGRTLRDAGKPNDRREFRPRD